MYPRYRICIPLLHGLGCRRDGLPPCPEVKFVGFTPSFVRFVAQGGRFASALLVPFSRKGMTIDMNNTSRTSVRTLVMLALLVAMSIVFSRVLSISTGFVRFNLGSLPVLLAALLFGPGAGFAVGAVADIIGGVLAGYAINPLITLGAGAIGLVAGYAWQKLPDYRTGLRLSISVLLGHFVGSMVINSLALRIFYGYAWSVLLARIPNALVLSAAASGQVKPDFAAPGVNVIGPVPGNRFEARSGTSIAAAITAGAAALYLEWAVERGYNTDITNAEIKNDFIRGAVRLESRVYPNREWGYGTLNLYQTFEQLRRT